MDALLTENINRLWASLIVDELLQQGVDQFYVSPGLRNAPLLAALSEPQEKGNIDIVMDERSAAYKALGYAKNTGKAAVLICTSGTAMANYYPAVIEAWKSRVPLVILSTDRPPELNEADANQTIGQKNLYGPYIKGEINFESPTEEIPPRSMRTSIAHILATAHFPSLGGGPVHINLPFRDPLDADASNPPSENYTNLARETMERKSTAYAETYPQVGLEDLQEVVKKIQETPKTLFVVGELSTWVEKESFVQLAERLNIPVYFDVLSSLKYRFPITSDSNIGPSPSFDHPEVFGQFTDNPPTFIIHIGGRLVSKHYYKFLQQNPQIELYTVNDGRQKEDPSFQTTKRFIARPDIFAQNLMDYLKGANLEREHFEFQQFNWANFVRKKETIIDQAPLSYPVISKSIIETIPEGSTLYLGNSTIIRSFDSYASESVCKNLRILGHRGASGIEGFISAASGAADASEQSHTRPLTLVLGDVAALHDLGGLESLSKSRVPIICFIVNNRGGGIFSLIPMQQCSNVKKLMMSPHERHFRSFAEGFDLPYTLVTQKDELKPLYSRALRETQNDGRSRVFELQFDHQTNFDLYQQLRTIKL